jgi:polygalacturonase
MTTLIPKINFKNGGVLPTGAATRSIDSKLQDVVSVKDFGAVSDGVTDDTAAFTNAWAASNPKAVLVPAGSYKITGTVTGKFYSFGVVTIVTGTVTSITNLVP